MDLYDKTVLVEGLLKLTEGYHHYAHLTLEDGNIDDHHLQYEIKTILLEPEDLIYKKLIKIALEVLLSMTMQDREDFFDFGAAFVNRDEVKSKSGELKTENK